VTIIIGILCIIYVALFILYTIGWDKVAITHPELTLKNKIAFSIIIPARNEEQNIQKILNSILYNHYDKTCYEIIVVDDFSEDNTASLADITFKKHQFDNGWILKLSEIDYDFSQIKSYKKKAIELAIQASKFEYIITTDADCTVPLNWLKSFQTPYLKNPNTKAVIGGVNFTALDRKNILYFLQSIDFMTMQGITVASYKMKMGNMCNGANFSYKKEYFYAVGGFEGINNLASGDDMMLLNKLKKAYPNDISYIKSKDNIVETPIQNTWKSFFNQRVRWASKNGKYNDYILNTILISVYFFNLLLLLGVIYCVFKPEYVYYLLSVWLIKYIVELIFIYPVAKFFNKTNELLYHFILQPLHVSYIIATGFLGMFKKYEWKGRTIKK
jgi:cellulose synthase/poly-beta-1,6-N-acetylglucosamine synthase-like glycosyltransferase